MKEITIYRVEMTGTHETEADNTQDAQDKTIAYFAANLDKLVFKVTTTKVWIEEEE